MALGRCAPPWRISLWTRQAQSIDPASRLLPDCRVTADLGQAVAGAGIVVLCMPPHAIEASGKMLAGLLAPDAVVTDAGSVKERIVAALERDLGACFVGAHPMAGSEESGIEAARPGLFDRALCILTPTPDSDPRALAAVRRLWADAGCTLKEMTPGEHDRAIARVSHLPHAVAAALVRAACAQGTDVTGLAGSGYRDSTRIAAGPESLWAEILLDNREEVLAGIGDLQVLLAELKAGLARGDRSAIEAFLGEARQLRTQKNPAT